MEEHYIERQCNVICQVCSCGFHSSTELGYQHFKEFKLLETPISFSTEEIILAKEKDNQ